MIDIMRKFVKIRFPRNQESWEVPSLKWWRPPPASRWWLRPAPSCGRWTWMWSSWWWSPCSVSCRESSELNLLVFQHLQAQLLPALSTLSVGSVSVLGLCLVWRQTRLVQWSLNTETLCLEENFIFGFVKCGSDLKGSYQAEVKRNSLMWKWLNWKLSDYDEKLTNHEEKL